jgi:hypothetical protein
MAPPDILALDFDGVLCDGMREYFEASRRTYARVWPEAPPPADGLFADFRALRPVITSGWEMPLLLRAIAEGRSRDAVLRDWAAVRDAIVAALSPDREALVARLGAALDAVRREWIAADPAAWLDHNLPYCPLGDLRDLVAAPERAILVTTKEGEFARLILERWAVPIADIQGKEAGSHKCDNLRAAISAYTASRGRRPRLAFVEDRLETLRHVTTHPDLDDVRLYLAAWGYNTPEARDGARRDPRIRLLELQQFTGGLAAWPAAAPG